MLLKASTLMMCGTRLATLFANMHDFAAQVKGTKMRPACWPDGLSETGWCRCCCSWTFPWMLLVTCFHLKWSRRVGWIRRRKRRGRTGRSSWLSTFGWHCEEWFRNLQNLIQLKSHPFCVASITPRFRQSWNGKKFQWISSMRQPTRRSLSRASKWAPTW